MRVGGRSYRERMIERRQFVWAVTETAGFESCWLTADGLALHAEGHAVAQSPAPYWLFYTLDTDDRAATTRITVTAVTESARRELDLRRTGSQWTVDGVVRPDLGDAHDCDLAFSPLTNTMPILRTDLHRRPGHADFHMAFIEVPSLEVTPSRQSYTHLTTTPDGASVRFTSGTYTQDLLVDRDAIVVTYPTMAQRIPPLS